MLLQTSDLHQVWYTDLGNPEGVPLLLFHGGPGSQSKPKHLKGIDLEKYRVIQFDQRGCGQSLPAGEIRENTTQDILSDIEKIRQELGIERWILVAGSWGATLALLYAEANPDRVAGMMLRSVMLARKKDIDWLFSGNGAANIVPELWQRRSDFLAEKQISLEDYNKQALAVLENGNFAQQQEIAAFIDDLEANIVNFQVGLEKHDPLDVTIEEINAARIYLYYFLNNYFIKDNQILDNIGSIKHIPVRIIHGRYDLVCPVEQSYLLHKQLPKSKLEILLYDGHKLGDTAMSVQSYMLSELAATS